MNAQRRRTRSKVTAAARAAQDKQRQQVLHNAIAAHQQGHLSQAEHLYRTLLDANPENVDALHMLGVLANQVGQSAVACDLIARAIALRPDLKQFQYNYGVVLQAEGRHEEAVTAYRQALEVQGQRAAVHENLGTALHDLGRSQEASVCWDKALQLDPASAVARKNLGTQAFNRGDTGGARRHFEALVSLDPASAAAHEKLATALLREGDFERGFEHYEWRFCSPSFIEKNPPPFAPYPKWTGTPLDGKTLLISAEQGVGDEVMFASFYNTLIAQAALCVIECDPRLVRLFQRSFANALIVARGEIPDNVAIDWRIGAGSLPRLLGWRPAAERPTQPWLSPDAAALSRWRAHFARGGSTLNVGIAWRGGGDERARRARSIELSAWRGLLEQPGVRVVSLQYGDHAAEIEAFNAAGGAPLECAHGLDPTQDLDDLSALIGALDLVVTIDNSTVHLAGAVGTPASLLLPPGPDWRWQDGQDRSAWYPDVRFFRQERQSAGGWTRVLADVVADLERRTSKGVTARECLTPDTPLVDRGRATSDVTGPAWVLLNDTTNWYHWGCTATSLAIHRELRRHGRVVAALPIYAAGDLPGVPADAAGFARAKVFERFRQLHPQLVAQLEQADAICINGEGTLHRLSRAAVNLLYLAHVAAAHLRKPVHIVNHSCYPEGGTNGDDPEARALYRLVYGNAEHIAVREGVSANVLRDLGLPVVETFDCLPIYVDEMWQANVPDGADYVLLAGCAHWPGGLQAAFPNLVSRLTEQGIEVRLVLGANAFPAVDDLQFAQAMLSACPGRIAVHWTHSESDWLNAIAGARLLVSGRFHHSIAAAFVDTPFVVAQSNTPKIDGLLERLQLDNALDPVRDDKQLSRALWSAAQERLFEPAEHRLSPSTRAELLTLARRNFVANPGEISPRQFESTTAAV